MRRRSFRRANKVLHNLAFYPSWLSGLSPRMASTATRALNFALYCFLVIADFSLVNDSVEILAYCLV